MSITADIFISSVYKARNGFRLFFMDCTASYSQQEITSLPLSFVLNYFWGPKAILFIGLTAIC